MTGTQLDTLPGGQRRSWPAQARMGPSRPVGSRKELAGSRQDGKSRASGRTHRVICSRRLQVKGPVLGGPGQQGGKAIRLASGSRARVRLRLGSRLGGGTGTCRGANTQATRVNTVTHTDSVGTHFYTFTVMHTDTPPSHNMQQAQLQMCTHTRMHARTSHTCVHWHPHAQQPQLLRFVDSRQLALATRPPGLLSHVLGPSCPNPCLVSRSQKIRGSCSPR